MYVTVCLCLCLCSSCSCSPTSRTHARSYVSRSLFNADRLTFGMHMARHMAGAGAIKPEEWAYFLGGCPFVLMVSRGIL